MIWLFGFLLISIAVNSQKVDDIDLTPAECLELGLNRDALKCSACEFLPQFNLDELFSDCKRCCTQDKTTTHEKYPLAQIEYCECNIQRFPQVNAFVKSSNLNSQWGSKLKIKHVRGTLPTIVLKSADGQPQKTLNIERWDTDTITQFINEWIDE